MINNKYKKPKSYDSQFQRYYKLKYHLICKKRQFTKIQFYELIKEIVSYSGNQYTDEILSFCDAEIQRARVMNSKSGKTRYEDAKRNSMVIQELLEESLFEDKPQTIEDLLDQIEGLDGLPFISFNTAAFHLGKLVREGIAQKKIIKHKSYYVKSPEDGSLVSDRIWYGINKKG